MDSACLPALVAGLNWHLRLRMEPWLLVAARRTAFSAPVVAFGAAPDARDLLLQQGKLRLEFHDALTMALNLLQQGIEFRADALRHRAKDIKSRRLCVYTKYLRGLDIRRSPEAESRPKPRPAPRS